MMPSSSRANAGSFPGNRGRGVHRRQESTATTLSPIDQIADAVNKLNADADGIKEIIAEVSKVHKHMAMLLGRAQTNFPKLRPDEIQDKDLKRRVDDLREKKIGTVGNDLEAAISAQKAIWQALIQLTQNIDEVLGEVGTEGGDVIS